MTGREVEKDHSVGCEQWRSKGDWRACICAKESAESAATDPIPRCEHGAPIWACNDATKRLVERLGNLVCPPATTGGGS